MSHPSRLAPRSYLGAQRLFLTLCTHCRQRYFTDASIVALVHSHGLRTCARQQFDVLAYCYMPDHLHMLLVTASATADASRLARFLKQTTAFHFRRCHGRPLWQRSYFDRTLRADQDVKDVITYVVMNPVRAGLVQSVQEYRFWGSSLYDRREIVEFVAEHGRPT